MDISSLKSKVEETFFSSKKRLIGTLFGLTLLLSIPVTMSLVLQQQDIRQRAACNMYEDILLCNPNGNGEVCVKSQAYNCELRCQKCEYPVGSKCMPSSEGPSNMLGACILPGDPTPITCPAAGTLVKSYCVGNIVYTQQYTGMYRSDLGACGVTNGQAYNNCSSSNQTCITDSATSAHCGTSSTCAARDTNCNKFCNGNKISEKCSDGACGDYTKDTACPNGCYDTSGTPTCYASPAPNVTAVSPSGTTNTLFPIFQISVDAPWNYISIGVSRVSDGKIMWNYQPGIYSANGVAGTYSVVYGAGAGTAEWMPQLEFGKQYMWSAKAQYGTDGKHVGIPIDTYFTVVNSSVTATPTPKCPAAGTIIRPFCETSRGAACVGNIYADGSCGTYRNCVDCPSNACSGTSCAPCPAPVISTRCCDGNVCQDATYTPSSCGGTVTKITTCSSGCVTDSSTAAHCKGTPSATPTPTTGPTATPRPIASPTVAITPVTTPIPGVNISLNLRLPGIGTGSGSNTAPKRTTRTAKITIFDVSGQPVVDTVVGLSYANGVYTGLAPMGTLTPGSYEVKVKLENTLWKRIPGILVISSGTQVFAPATLDLISGDISGTNLIDLSDYNAILTCYAGTCAANIKSLVDFNDDGTVDAKDLNILLRAFANRQGD